MSTFFIVIGLPVLLLVSGLLLYPVAQAFGIVGCNCGRSPEDKWRLDDKQSAEK